MNDFIQILITYGDFGMFIAAFLAGSFFPFSSEAVMLGLLAAGADPDGLVVWGTAGNTLGSLFNYGVGSLGRDEWILRGRIRREESIACRRARGFPPPLPWK